MADPDPDKHFFRSWIRIRFYVNLSCIRISIKKSQNSWALDPQNGAVDAQNGGVEAQIDPCRVCVPVFAESHNLDDEQDPDLDPRLTENW